MRRRLWGLGIAVVAMGLGWGMKGSVAQAGTDGEAARPEFYTAKVRPIFQSNCFRCHAGMNRRGGLSMSTRKGMMKGGKDGMVVVAGDPGRSLLVQGIRHEGRAKPMPEKDSKLSDADIATVERWIRAGAAMPVDPSVQ